MSLENIYRLLWVLAILVIASVPSLAYITLRNAWVIDDVAKSQNITSQQAEAAKNQSLQNNQQIREVNRTIKMMNATASDFYADRNTAFNITLKELSGIALSQKQTEENILGNLTDHRIITNLTRDQILNILNNESR